MLSFSFLNVCGLPLPRPLFPDLPEGSASVLWLAPLPPAAAITSSLGTGEATGLQLLTAMGRCAKPSGVPRGPATSTGSLASQRHPGKFPKVPGRRRPKQETKVKPAEAHRGLAHPGPQPALLQDATPGAAPEPHLELAGHGHHLMVRRVVLVAVREHQSDIGTKFLSITVLTGLQFRLKRQDGSWLVTAAYAPRRAVRRSKSTSQWLGV